MHCFDLHFVRNEFTIFSFISSADVFDSSCSTLRFDQSRRWVFCRRHKIVRISMSLILRVNIFSFVRSIADWHIQRTISTRSEILYLRRVADSLNIEFFWFEETENCKSKTIVSIFRKCRFRLFSIIECRSSTLKEFNRACALIFWLYSDVSFVVWMSL